MCLTTDQRMTPARILRPPRSLLALVAPVAIALGDTARLRAFVVDTLGARTAAAAVAFTIADGSRPTVDSAGNAVGTDSGTTVVRATAGSLRDSVVVSVRGFYIQLDTAAMFVGGGRTLAGRRYLANGEPGLIAPGATWSISDSTVVSVSRAADGTLRVTGVRPGHATVTARFLNARAASGIFVEPRPTLRFASVDGGFLTTCALGVDGVPYCRGYGSSGLLCGTRPSPSPSAPWPWGPARRAGWGETTTSTAGARPARGSTPTTRTTGGRRRSCVSLGSREVLPIEERRLPCVA